MFVFVCIRSLHKAAYSPMDKLRIHLNVENGSSVDVTDITVKVNILIKFHHVVNNTKHFSRSIGNSQTLRFIPNVVTLFLDTMCPKHVKIFEG